MKVPAEMLTRNGRVESPAIPTSTTIDDERLREWARQHVERVRRLKLHIVAFVLGMIVLTAVWLFVEWQSNGGFERWSANGNPGDWDPWVLYVALAWGLLVAFVALRTYFDRPTTDAEIDREIERLRERR